MLLARVRVIESSRSNNRANYRVQHKSTHLSIPKMQKLEKTLVGLMVYPKAKTS
jgi:hypothetical protein